MQISSILTKNRDNLLSFGATLSRSSSRFLLIFLASYLLSKYEFGLFNIFLSIYFFGRLFSENSLNLPFIKYASDGQNRPEVVNFQMIVLKIVYVLLVSMAILVFADPIVEFSGLERKELLYLLPFMLFALTAYMFVGQVLIARLQMKQLMFYELLNGLVLVLFFLLGYYWLRSFNTEMLVILYSAAMACAACLGFFLNRSSIKIATGLNKELLWKLVHYSKFTVLSGISSLVILKADVLMLGFFRSPREVGVYGMALFVNEAVQMVFDSVLRICLPKASALSSVADDSKMRQLFHQSVKNMYIGIVPIVLIIGFAAPATIHMVYGGKYDDSFGIIYLFLASSIVKPVGYVAGVILGATGNIRFDNRNCWISAMLNLVCNYLLIPKYGVMGAAIASTISFISLTVLHYYSLQRVVFGRNAH